MDKGENVFIYGHKFLMHLEGTALKIWQLLDGINTMSNIIDLLVREYGELEKEKISEDTLNHILELEKAGLVAWRSRPLFEDVILDD